MAPSKRNVSRVSHFNNKLRDQFAHRIVLCILKFIVRADRGAEGAENQLEWSGAVSRTCRKMMERGAGLNYKNRLERGAAFSWCAHAPLTCSGACPEQMLDSLVRFGEWSDVIRCGPMR